ncbi:cupin domain-containing protein [Bauldia sp.]|uniref:cupin domain-containing protein n=1 Tax=Bauldia sp. TaxID=2575872 RepID=UPI003BA8BA7E
MSFALLGRSGLALLATIAMPTVAVSEESQQYQNLLTQLFADNKTIIGQAIDAYPTGTPKITAVIVTVPPGKDSGWHTHRVPLFIYVMEGEITVDYGEKGKKVYKAGDTFLEAMDWPHTGINTSNAPVIIMAVYMGVEGTPNAEAVEASQ